LSEDRPKRRWTKRRVAVALGILPHPALQPAPPPVPGETVEEGRAAEKARDIRIEDILTPLGIKGGVFGAIAAALLKLAASNDRVAVAMEHQTEVVSQHMAAQVEVGKQQVYEIRESRLVTMGELQDLKRAVWGRHGADEPTRPARVRAAPAAPADRPAPEPTRIP